jgi:hypothetical protein
MGIICHLSSVHVRACVCVYTGVCKNVWTSVAHAEHSECLTTATDETYDSMTEEHTGHCDTHIVTGTETM